MLAMIDPRAVVEEAFVMAGGSDDDEPGAAEELEAGVVGTGLSLVT